MSKQMTPCEKLGYKVGDKFVMKINDYHKQGKTVFLERDDGTDRPIFSGRFVWLSSVNKVAKLKPAKQALADAIHQNGGWPKECHWMFAASNGFGSAFCCTNKPKRSGRNWLGGGKFTPCCEIGAPIPNWHQCILSRDEYLTAYPEQVKVEVNNETEHKVEFEMESESEVTIKVRDWHKNGELPPVGEVVMLNSTNPNDYWSHHVGAELTVVAHDKDSRGVGIAVYRFVDADGYNEYHGLVAHAFMPLRTERDKAIDEMINVGGLRARDGAREVFGRLYDAGMYKEVK